MFNKVNKYISRCQWCNKEYNWRTVQIDSNYVKGANPSYCSDECKQLKIDCFDYAHSKYGEAIEEFRANNGYAFKWTTE